jgi:RNA polymerase sigma factor for flagellar operon FliA
MAISPPSPTGPSPEQLYLSHLSFIEKTAVRVTRRYFSREEMEDFVSTVKLRLLEDDYAVIRKFKGDSKFQTFLTTVIGHQMQDYRNSLWGKWRPREEVKRLGPVAVRLFILTGRDGYSVDQACEILRTNEKVPLTREELENLAKQLPPFNPPRRMEKEEELETQPAQAPSPELEILGRETAQRKKLVLEMLRKVLSTLPAEDRLIAKLRSEMQVAQIAKTLHLDQKPLYRRIGKIFEKVRQTLEEQGIKAEDVRDILGFSEEEIDEEAEE